MFYNHDFMTSRKAGLRIIWLASTLGSQSRRLTKKDYATVDVVKTCNTVSNPAQPLALRTSSHLMYGVARVYTKQAEFWMNDVQTHYEQVTKIMAGGGGARKQLGGLVILGKDTTSIDMPERSRANAITIPARYDFFATHANIDMQWTDNESIGDSNVRHGSLASFRQGSQSSSFGGIGRGLQHSSSFSDLNAGRYTLDPSVIRKARTPSIAGDFETPLLDLGLPNEIIDGEGIDLGLLADERSVMPLDNDGFDLPGDWQDDGGMPTAGQNQNPRVRPRSPSLEAQQQPPRAKKIRFALSDSTTELSNETVLHWRENIAAKMTEFQGVIMEKTVQKYAREEVDHLVFGSNATNPLLAQFWVHSVSSLRTALDLRLAGAHIEDPGVGRLMQTDGNDQMRPDWQDDTLFQQWDEDPGVGRGAFPSSSPAPASGRVRGSQSSERRNALPWDQPLPRVDMTGEGDVTNQTLSQISIETPTGLRRHSRRQSSLTVGSIGQPEIEDGHLSREGPSQQQVLNESQSQGLVQNEDANFMSYVNQIRASLPSEQPLFFSDLAPVAGSTPHLAARAFYNMLSLATTKLVRVDQQAPYGEIEIAVVAT